MDNNGSSPFSFPEGGRERLAKAAPRLEEMLSSAQARLGDSPEGLIHVQGAMWGVLTAIFSATLSRAGAPERVRQEAIGLIADLIKTYHTPAEAQKIILPLIRATMSDMADAQPRSR